MTCRKAMQFIDDFIDGSLDELLFLEIEEHTQNCRKCQTKFDELSRLRSLLRNFEVPAPEQVYFNQVTDSILSKIFSRSHSPTRIH